MLPVGYRASQPKVDCSQGVSADNYVENGAPLPQVEFSYETGGRERLTEVLISDDSVFWDHADDVLLSRLLGERMERQRHTVVQSLLQKMFNAEGENTNTIPIHDKTRLGMI